MDDDPRQLDAILKDLAELKRELSAMTTMGEIIVAIFVTMAAAVAILRLVT